MLPGHRSACDCPCHRAPDEESPPIVLVSLFDPIETYAAGACCRNHHWRAIYFATEAKPPAPREKTKWVDGASDAQGDGWK